MRLVHEQTSLSTISASLYEAPLNRKPNDRWRLRTFGSALKWFALEPTDGFTPSCFAPGVHSEQAIKLLRCRVTN